MLNKLLKIVDSNPYLLTCMTPTGRCYHSLSVGFDSFYYLTNTPRKRRRKENVFHSNCLVKAIGYGEIPVGHAKEHQASAKIYASWKKI